MEVNKERRYLIPKEIKATLKDAFRVLVRDGVYAADSDRFLLQIYDIVQEVVDEEDRLAAKEKFCDTIADAIVEYMAVAYSDIDEDYNYGDYLAIGERWLEKLEESMDECRALHQKGYSKIDGDFVMVNEDGTVAVKDWGLFD